MLGMICGDYSVGLYSVAVKIYTIVKNVFTAILTVMMQDFLICSRMKNLEVARNCGPMF